MPGTSVALVVVLAWTTIREYRIMRLRQALRNRLASKDGQMASVAVAPVCRVNMLDGRALRQARICVDEVRTPSEWYRPTSTLISDIKVEWLEMGGHPVAGGEA